MLCLAVEAARLVDVELFCLLVLRELAEIPVEVSHHLLEEYDSLCSLDVVLVGHDFLLDQLDQVVADLSEFLLDFCLVFGKTVLQTIVLLCLSSDGLDDL